MADSRIAASISGLTALDLRAAAIGYRLQTHGLDYCRHQTDLPGWVVQDAAQYRAELRPAADALYHLNQGPAITAIVAGGAADKAGFRVGDVIRTVNGSPLASTQDVRANKPTGIGYEHIIDTLDRAFAAGPVTVVIERDGQPLTIRFQGERGCASDIQVELTSSLNADADGKIISVSQRMMRYASGDDALAFIMSHELSHDILGHREMLDDEHVKLGLLKYVGKNLSRIRDTEQQADYLGIYLAAAAGYDLDAVDVFWRRYTNEHGAGILNDGTHLGDGARVRFIDAVIAEVKAKHSRGEPLTPDYQRFIHGLGIVA
jgi:hypothetical protein